MAATPGSFTETGLLTSGGLRSFLPELERTDARYDRTVISEASYAANHVGNMTLHVVPGFDTQWVGGQLVVGYDEPLTEPRGIG
jgi:hypothetical protein